MIATSPTKRLPFALVLLLLVVVITANKNYNLKLSRAISYPNARRAHRYKRIATMILRSTRKKIQRRYKSR